MSAETTSSPPTAAGLCIEDGLWVLQQGRGWHGAADARLAAGAIARSFRTRGTRAFGDWDQDGAVLLWSRKLLFVVAPKTPGIPVYWAVAGGQIHIASEIFALGLQRLELGGAASNERRLHDAPMHTAFEGVYSIPAAHYCVIPDEDPEQARLFPYWSPCGETAPDDDDDLIVALERTLERAVRRRSAASMLGLVSGGVDSSLLACLAARAGVRLETFSVGTATNNEFRSAEMLARHLRSCHNEIVLTERDLLDHYGEVVSLLEHPFHTYVEYLVPGYVALKRCARPGQTVLSGYGSDIVFGGFATPGMSLPEVDLLVETEYRTSYWSNERAPALTGVADVELATPFFDPLVVRRALGIPSNRKLVGGKEKWILRKVAERMLPPAIAWRPKLGIHQSTGMSSCMDRVLGPRQSAAELVRQKQHLTLEILRLTHCERMPVHEIDLHGILATLAAGKS